MPNREARYIPEDKIMTRVAISSRTPRTPPPVAVLALWNTSLGLARHTVRYVPPSRSKTVHRHIPTPPRACVCEQIKEHSSPLIFEHNGTSRLKGLVPSRHYPNREPTILDTNCAVFPTRANNVTFEHTFLSLFYYRTIQRQTKHKRSNIRTSYLYTV